MRMQVCGNDGRTRYVHKFLCLATELTVIFSVALHVVSAGSRDYTRYVNPFVGTDGHGHTFPGATMPFGMVQLSPDTRVEGWDACGGYHWTDSSILGFSHTHLSGTGVADYGDILITPTVRLHSSASTANLAAIALPFHHTEELASPGYYSVTFSRDNIKAELTATQRVGIHRYTFSPHDTAAVVIDLHHGLGPDRVIESFLRAVSTTEVEGYRRSEGWAKDQNIYFVATFSRPFIASQCVDGDAAEGPLRRIEGTNVKGILFFEPSAEPIVVHVALSSVSPDGARTNLSAEVAGKHFDDLRRSAELSWNIELGKIEVEGGSSAQDSTFYTALYHAMIAPNVFSDVDGAYRGMDGRIHRANGFDMYTVFSLWDTFRAEHPLLTIIDPKRTLDFIQSLLAKYDEAGVLPVWELASNETWCMIGYHAVPVIVDAYRKGIRGFDAEKALAAMKVSASLHHYGLVSYRNYGFIPAEDEAESVSKTLEYAYDDWCIAVFARDLGRMADYHSFIERAQYYRNIFDASTGFFRPKINGGWFVPFDPTSVTVHFTEANPWQYNFFVPQDIEGMVQLHGGKERFTSKLDSLFSSSAGLSGRQQSDISGLIGQYAQGNEPSHHVAYLYNYAGQPWKTQQTVRLLMDSLYTPRPDGLCGNDDCGQMSAWYVLSALGFYQVTPGLPQYSIGSPLFRQAVIHLEHGTSFTITADRSSLRDMFIHDALLDDNSLSFPFISHDDILKSRSLRFDVRSSPGTHWGMPGHQASTIPAEDRIVTVPVIEARSRSFRDSLTVGVTSDEVLRIVYELNGTKDIYHAPIKLEKSARLRVRAERSDRTQSRPVIAMFEKFMPIGSLLLRTRYSAQYTGGGDSALVDGLMGGNDFRFGEWQGYHGVDLDALVDLGEIKEIHQVSLGCLQDNNSWIFYPTKVELSVGRDSVSSVAAVTVTNPASPHDTRVRRDEFGYDFAGVRARYVRIVATNIGLCPPGHKGAGEPAWLFVDEISVR